MSKYTEAKRTANRKWDAENLYKFSVNLPIDYKDRVKALAERREVSVNRMIRDLIDAALAADQEP